MQNSYVLEQATRERLGRIRSWSRHTVSGQGCKKHNMRLGRVYTTNTNMRPTTVQQDCGKLKIAHQAGLLLQLLEQRVDACEERVRPVVRVLRRERHQRDVVAVVVGHRAEPIEHRVASEDA